MVLHNPQTKQPRPLNLGFYFVPHPKPLQWGFICIQKGSIVNSAQPKTLFRLGRGQIHVRRQKRGPMEKPPGNENRTTANDQKRPDSLWLLLGRGFSGNHIGYLYFGQAFEWQLLNHISNLTSPMISSTKNTKAQAVKPGLIFYLKP